MTTLFKKITKIWPFAAFYEIDVASCCKFEHPLIYLKPFTKLILSNDFVISPNIIKYYMETNRN